MTTHIDDANIEATGVNVRERTAWQRCPIAQRVASLTDEQRAAYDTLKERGKVTLDEAVQLGIDRRALDHVAALDLATLHRDVWTFRTGTARVSAADGMHVSRAIALGIVDELDAAVTAEELACAGGMYVVRTLVIEYDPRWPDSPPPGATRHLRWCPHHEWRETACCTLWDAHATVSTPMPQ